MFTDNRDAFRHAFFDTWQKYQKKMLLTLEESRLIEVILDHPQYHRYFDDPKTHLKQEYEFEENPFLHLSLHMTLREQLRLDRPTGIKEIYTQLAKDHPSLEVEHMMLPTLVMMLQQGQQSGVMPTDDEYVAKLRELIK